MTDTTADHLLGGRVQFRQPARGYRAAIDPVLLAASVPARDGESVLEGGTGAGAAALCLLARLGGISLRGIEIDPALAALARANATTNAMADRMEVIEADLLGCRAGRFDHAMANPPFQPHGSGSESPDASRRRADREPAPGMLAGWIDALARHLAPRGSLTLVLPAARLSECMAACRAAGLGAIGVLPVSPRPGQAAGRILVQGRKAARGPDRLLAPLVLHQPDGRFTPEADAVLRGGAALTI